MMLFRVKDYNLSNEKVALVQLDRSKYFNLNQASEQ